MEDQHYINLILQPNDVSCSLNTNELEIRRMEIIHNLTQNILSKQEDKTGYSIEFPYTSEIAHDLLDFIMKEQQCCSFFQFQVNFNKKMDRIILNISSETVDQDAITNIVDALLS